MSNGTTETLTLPIEVVRPSLMMVHGLASSEAAFRAFNYNGGVTDVPFIGSPLFRHKKAINLIPNAEFAVNANVILSPNCGGCGINGQSSNYLNTFQGNIDALRQQGYAANQVDYVCHSTGGCVLRTAMTVFANKFYGTAGAANDIYKSYGKGFVHKAITINTPHNSSPVADAITEYIPQLSNSTNIALTAAYAAFPNNVPYADISPWDFIKPADPNNLPFTFEATGAVRNLQVKGVGGVNLAATDVKHHLIAGDVDLYSPETASTLVALDKYVDLLDKILKAMRDKLPPSPEKTYLTSLICSY